jgi:hypothetical protein
MKKWFLESIKGQRGAINLAASLMMAISLVFIAVGFIMFPNVTDATDGILAYAYSDNASITDATYTGLTAITGITPLLVLLGYVFICVIAGLLGFKAMKGMSSVSLNPGGLILIAISLVFIALGLYMFPVALDGISSVVHGGGSGISSDYTGLEPILKVTPMLILLAFVAAQVLTGYFGVKSLGRGR